jgi:GNAT superfamily N-acetyltransferase
MSETILIVRPVGRGNFDDLARLFEARGGPSNCWCLVWRSKPKATADGSADERKAARKAVMRALVQSDIPVGLLAYDRTEPVGWCSVGPRESYLNLGGPDAAEGTVWALVCFYVPNARRGQGIAQRLLDVAITTARAGGATILEATPVDPESPSYRFMGFVPFFAKAGFAEVGRAGSRRHVMRMSLR